ncbi:MAG: hypothetical protein K0R82_1314 [Flavipsychrobacter sp.]|jgi:uncharacterized protein YecE (DUF72 family)|nr:hypothetical protein [Flavipsychrobacter sp.]
MEDGKIYIGTSGWSYKDWRGVYYPERLPSKEWLAHYTGDFEVIEINSSFYRLPKIETVEKWTAAVPKDFKFCPKISRFLTHVKRLKEPEEPLQRFFGIFEPMKKKLGPVLVQLPPNLKFDYEVTEYFFKQLKKCKTYDFALEVRHETWMDDHVLDLMAQYNVAFVISQSGVGFPYSEMVTAKNIYVRFHGPKELYASLYSDAMLRKFAKKFKVWLKEGHDIWVFFNNDWYTYAIRNGLTLKKLME